MSICQSKGTVDISCKKIAVENCNNQFKLLDIISLGWCHVLCVSGWNICCDSIVLFTDALPICITHLLRPCWLYVFFLFISFLFFDQEWHAFLFSGCVGKQQDCSSGRIWNIIHILGVMRDSSLSSLDRVISRGHRERNPDSCCNAGLGGGKVVKDRT